MNPWKLVRDKLVFNRKEDEAYYAAALSEFQSGQIRVGLMAKAMAECGGDEHKAKSIYIKLLAYAIRDDIYIKNRSKEEALRNAQRIRNNLERAKDEEAEAKVFKSALKINSVPMIKEDHRNNFSVFGFIFGFIFIGFLFNLFFFLIASKLTFLRLASIYEPWWFGYFSISFIGGLYWEKVKRVHLS